MTSLLFYLNVINPGRKRYYLRSTLYATLAKHEIYPAKFVQMINIAEVYNKLECFFEQLATQYTEEVEYKTNAITDLLEPFDHYTSWVWPLE